MAKARARTKAAPNYGDDSNRFLKVDDVMEILQVGKSTAYRAMQNVNKQLQAEGKLTIAGRVSKKHLMECYF
ncbi:MAG: helix-turn-helix domain-containing protein [Eubacterium sp.]|nr:helix-turn-helix domain-containing protein [Eubacterium sp.]